MSDTPERLEMQVSGGCQCGAVRFHGSAILANGSICHCRMCQKAVGNYFAALIGIPRDCLTWTRGEPSVFQSSEPVRRGFCKDCGTPLFYDYADSRYVSVTCGSLDEPAKFPPVKQFGIEGVMPFFGSLHSLPGDQTTEEDMSDVVGTIASTNRQHPDHDTQDFSDKDA